MMTLNQSDQHPPVQPVESQIPLRTSVLTVASLVLGCLGPLGTIAMNEITNSANRLKGHSMALTD